MSFSCVGWFRLSCGGSWAAHARLARSPSCFSPGVLYQGHSAGLRLARRTP